MPTIFVRWINAKTAAVTNRQNMLLFLFFLRLEIKIPHLFILTFFCLFYD
jgi:hypothetical protein